MAACEAACERGIAGDGGCFAAGRALQRTAALDYESAAYQQARDFLQKSCNGGHGDGCLYAAQVLEAPFANIDFGALDKGPPTLISDAELARRQELLVKACELGSVDGCKRMGDVTIGKNAELSKKGYVAACKKSAHAAECETARAGEIALFERYRAGCQRRVMDDCATLGNLVFRLDVPRAIRVFVAEAETRGIVEIGGGLGAIVASRAREAMARSQRVPPSKGGRSRLPEWVKVGRVEVVGRVPKATIRRTIERELSGSIVACAARVPDEPFDGVFTAGMTVDTTGDVWRAMVENSTLPDPVTRCLHDAFVSLQLPPPASGTATVRCSLVFERPRASVP